MIQSIIKTFTILTFVITLNLGLNISACPARVGSFDVKQPNGEILTIEIHGDVHFNYTTTSDGYLLTSNKENGWDYAKWENGSIVSLGIVAKNLDRRGAEEVKVLERNGKFGLVAGAIQNIRRMQNVSMLGENPPQQRAIGDPRRVERALVILVSFSDYQFTVDSPQKKFDNLLNQPGYSVNGAVGSAKDYFRSMSYGSYDPSFDVFGPIELDNTREYYGARNGDQNDKRPAQMVVDAFAKLMQSNSDIDLNNYDADNDGFIDNVYVFYAGPGESNGGGGNSIWPHQWTIQIGFNASGNVSYKGKTIANYACSSELYGGNGMCGIGTFCHEFTHVLGFPDIYDVGYSGHTTSGSWDLMDSGGHNENGHIPPGYTAYERFFMGWLKPQILNEYGQYTLPSLFASDTSAYIVTYSGKHNLDGARPISSIFYTIENRADTLWDTSTPGKGMLATLIKYNLGSWGANKVNVNPNDMGVDIIEPNNSYWYNDFTYPGTTNTRSFTPYAQYPLTNIQYENNLVSFDFAARINTVTFDAWDHGTCGSTSIAEAIEFSGITLPDVVENDGYEFEGWSKDISSKIVDAGGCGDTYYPKKDETLYAVYSQNGLIVEREFGCFRETFNALNCEGGENISRTIDEYADQEGWQGNYLYCSNGRVKVGNAESKGYLVSPELLTKGTANGTIRVKGEKISTFHIEVVGNGSLEEDEFKVFSSYIDLNFTITGCDLNTRLKFYAGINEFSIDSLEICKGIGSSTDIVDDEGVMVVGDGRIIGLKVGDKLRCYDISGKLMWEAESIAREYQMESAAGIYIVNVHRGNKIITLRCIKQ